MEPPKATASSTSSTALALLNLPIHTELSLDGSVTQILRKEEDLIVLTSLPAGFHLLTVKAGSTRKGTESAKDLNDGNSNMSVNMRLSIGLLIYVDDDSTNCSTTHFHSQLNLLVGKYDPQTEEISTVAPDDLTHENLRRSIETNKVDPSQSRFIQYESFMNINIGESAANVNVGRCRNGADISNMWKKHLTNLISTDVLSRHSLSGRGDKLLPGAFDEGDDENGMPIVGKINNDVDGSNMDSTDLDVKTGDKQIDGRNKNALAKLKDGVAIKYNPIPCLGMSLNLASANGSVFSSGLKAHTHSGTRRYLASLPPSHRTKLMMMGVENGMVMDDSQSQGGFVMEHIFKEYYEGKWKNMMGEFQLSFIVFISCSCLSSLEHWRDMICMLSAVDTITIAKHVQLYEALLGIVLHQLSGFDCSIFDDGDFTDGNVIIPSLAQIAHKCKTIANSVDGGGTMFEYAENMLQWMKGKFSFVQSYLNQLDFRQAEATALANNELSLDNNDDDSNDEDGPVIVSMDEIQASIDRSADKCNFIPKITESNGDRNYRERYPFLFASMTGDEDVVMACARILDEQCDVTLVREAAAYLEEVEINKSA